MSWLKLNWRWSAFNLFAVCVSVYVLSQGSTGWTNLDTFDTGLESGKWAIRFLLACLTMTPMSTYFDWKGAIKLRKSAGLWAFGFASMHVLFYIREAKLAWLRFPMPYFLLFGLVGMSILIVLASTSNRWAMQWLGKNWKRLHKLVYVSGSAVVTHSLLATAMSKKLIVRDPNAANELRIYVAILCVMLVVRIPIVRKVLKQIPVLLRNVGKTNKRVRPVSTPNPDTELWPKINGRESSVSVKPTIVISNQTSWKSEKGFSESLMDGAAEYILPEEEITVQS